MKNTLYALTAALALLLTGCGRETQREAELPGAVTVENINVENYFELGANVETFDRIPERVVIIGANESELLMDLGVTHGVIAAVPSQNTPRLASRNATGRCSTPFPR